MNYSQAFLIKILNILSTWCGIISTLFSSMEMKLARCPDCGKSLYYGAPCKVVNDYE